MAQPLSSIRPTQNAKNQMPMHIFSSKKCKRLLWAKNAIKDWRNALSVDRKSSLLPSVKKVGLIMYQDASGSHAWGYGEKWMSKHAVIVRMEIEL